MSDTPETPETHANDWYNMGGSLERPHYVVDVEVAQDLERRLIAAEAENAELRELLEQAKWDAFNAQGKS